MERTPQPYETLTAWLSHPIIDKMHGTHAWHSAARQGLLWTFVLEGPSAGWLSGDSRAPCARIHWPWPIGEKATSAHRLLAIQAATRGATPPAHAQQDAQGLWLTPLEPDDMDTWDDF